MINQEEAPVGGKRKSKKIAKIILVIIAIIFVIVSGLFIYGYFFYGKLIISFITEAVEKESKGLYHASIGSLNLNVINGDISVKNLELIPDTAHYRKMALTDTLTPMLFQMKMKKFTLERFGIMQAICNRKIEITGIRFIAPEITIYRMKTSEQAREDKPTQKLMSIPLPKGWNSIRIGKIELKKGSLDFYDLSGDSLVHQSFPSCFIMIKNILVDSAHQGKRRLFNADDISVTLNDISLKTKNGLNVISLGEIGLSTAANQAYIKDFHLIPQYDRHEYARRAVFQTDRLDISIHMLSLKRFNLRELVLGGKIKAGLLEIDSLVVDSYRDMRIPRKPGFKPPMPQDGIRKLKAYLKIDTVSFKNGKATYSEQVGIEAGTIYFDKMHGTLMGLTNDSVLLNAGLVSELKGTLYLMGKGKLDATVRFKFGDKRNAFTVSGNLGETDLREINPMLTKLLPAEISSGKVKQLMIPLITANDDVATGHLLFYYNNLSIAMTTEKKSTWNSVKKGVINFVANDLVVNNDNPTKKGKMKTGVIVFNRDKEKGIINFLWKSTLSGLKSTMGFNSEAQKELIKAEKDRSK